MILKTRSLQKEIMDGALGRAYTQAEYTRMFSEIELINRLSRGYVPSIKAIEKFAKQNPDRRLRVLDIGSGGGDTLRELHRWAVARGIALELVGVDLNPHAQALAEKRTPAEFGIKYITGNAFDLTGVDYDIMINSLMMHHLDDEEVVRLLSWMTTHARLGWFVNDLHRHPIAYHFIRMATRAFRFGRLVSHDAPLSIARAFSRSEWRGYLERAGVPLAQSEIRWHFPFRYGVSFRSAT